MDSPRGRIFHGKSLAEGRMTLSDSVVRHRRALPRRPRVRDVCPAGVPYGRSSSGQAESEHARPGSDPRRIFRWLNFGLLLEHPPVLRAAAAALRAYQVSGLQRLVRATGLVRLLPGTLPAWEQLLPRIPPASERRLLPARIAAEGERRGRVAMLEGCIQSVVFGGSQPRDGARAGAQRLGRRGAASTGLLRSRSTLTEGITPARSRWPSADDAFETAQADAMSSTRRGAAPT